MQKITIGRMAKLYGLHRSTLYEAVNKGRVSTGFDGKGQRVIELSEMIRVYGEPSGKVRHHPTSSPDTSQTPTDSEMLSRFDALIELVKEQRDELKALRDEVHQMRRLPAPEPQKGINSAQTHSGEQVSHTKPEPSEKPQEPRTPPIKATGTLSFADIEARLAKRLGRQS
jgi:hypothetical protein